MSTKANHNKVPVLITGAGLITPLGLDTQSTWEGIAAGRCGLGPLSVIEQPEAAPKGGGQAPDLPEDFASDQPREVRYLRWALNEAIDDAGLAESSDHPLDCPTHRIGFVLGTTLHGMRSGGRFLRSGDPKDLQTFLAGSVLQQVLADRPSWAGLAAAATTCSACSSALGAVALGVSLLESGQFDVVIAGGYDTVSEYVYAGFNSLRLVSPEAPKPFSKDRQGMKVSEGYGLVVLETQSRAQERGVKALAQVLGFGETADAHHLTQPHPHGDGAARAMAAALNRAELEPADIDLISAHATSTPDNDAAEFAAMQQVFGDRLSQLPVVAFKGHLGHTLGGAGAVELILAALAMDTQSVPPTANVQPDDIEYAGLNLVTGQQVREHSIGRTLNMSLGFGGANTCMILGTPPEPAAVPHQQAPSREVQKVIAVETPSRDGRRVLITGLGVLAPGAIGNQAFADYVAQTPAQSDRPDPSSSRGAIADADLADLIHARRTRRMSSYAKITLAAASLALADAGIADDPAFTASCNALLGTTHGASEYCFRYYQQIVEQGIDAANPMLFAEGVPNVASAHLSMALGIKGACQTIIGTRTAGLDALGLATMRIASGQWDRAIVGAAEEYSPVVARAYEGCYSPGSNNVASDQLDLACGAALLVLESEASASKRGAKVYAQVDSCKSAAGLQLNQTSNANQTQYFDRAIIHLGIFLGSVDQVITSLSGTWADQYEARLLDASSNGDRGQGQPRKQPLIYTSLGSQFGQLFSVSPLAGLAAVLLNQRLMATHSIQLSPEVQCKPANGDEPLAQRFALTAADWTGLLTTLLLSRPD
jgi:3-oxoacyl-[acyl-carrier-protein] synthase II